MPYQGSIKQNNYQHGSVPKIDLMSKFVEGQTKFLKELNELQNYEYYFCMQDSTLRSIHVPDQAVEMIIIFQVSSKQQYEAKYQNPIWPGASSGVTIGVGYDLAHVSPGEFANDWYSYLKEEDITRLKQVIGFSGQQAKNVVKTVQDIVIPWSSAKQVFSQRSLPKYQAMTQQIFPGCQELHPMSYGALVSLVYNRGASLSSIDSRMQMVNISKAFKGQIKYDGYIEDFIAGQIRNMKRIWQGKKLNGLLLRREKEASMIENNKKWKKMSEKQK